MSCQLSSRFLCSIPSSLSFQVGTLRALSRSLSVYNRLTATTYLLRKLEDTSTVISRLTFCLHTPPVCFPLTDWLNCTHHPRPLSCRHDLYLAVSRGVPAPSGDTDLTSFQFLVRLVWVQSQRPSFATVASNIAISSSPKRTSESIDTFLLAQL